MKATHFSAVRPLKNSQFWLLCIGAGLIAIHLAVTWRGDDLNLLVTSVLFWLAVSCLLWEKHRSLNLESGVFSSFLGGSLIAGVLLKSLFLTGGSYFPRLSPFVAALGLALLASGLKGLKQYWRELLLIFFLGVPEILLQQLIDPSAFTAKFAAFTLWYSGFDVTLHEFSIALPTGTIEVYPGCSGIEAIAQLLGLAVLSLVMFPLQGSKKILVPIVAVLLGFVINGVRVALLAILDRAEHPRAFDYWHEGDGSLIFSLISVLLFGLFYLFLLRQEKPEN